MRVFLTIFLLGMFSLIAEAKNVVKNFPFEQVTANGWVMHGPLGHPTAENQGFINNPGMIITEAGVVLVDPGSSVQVGEMVLRMVKQVTSAPIVATFNTHVHGDHWFGNQAIRAAYPDAPIYGHPNLIKEAEEGKAGQWLAMMDRLTEGFTRGTVAELPNRALNHGDEIKIGNHTFRMHHYGQSHTHTDLMVEVVEEKMVFLGDNAMSGRFGGMQDGTFLGNANALQQVLKSGAETWVPGHGGSEVVTTFADYLNTVYGAALYAFDEGIESDEVKPIVVEQTIHYRNWVGYELEIGRHVGYAYLEVEANEF